MKPEVVESNRNQITLARNATAATLNAPQIEALETEYQQWRSDNIAAAMKYYDQLSTATKQLPKQLPEVPELPGPFPGNAEHTPSPVDLLDQLFAFSIPQVDPLPNDGLHGHMINGRLVRGDDNPRSHNWLPDLPDSNVSFPTITGLLAEPSFYRQRFFRDNDRDLRGR